MAVAASATPGRTMVVLGAVLVVVGGLVAAVTGPFDWAKGSWAAAYLVLVMGVSQYVMGWMRRDGPQVGGWGQVAGWNLGSLLVIGGTLVGRPLLVDLGSVALVVALALALRADLQAGSRTPAWVTPAYRAMLLLLLVCIPIGILLSHLRN